MNTSSNVFWVKFTLWAESNRRDDRKHSQIFHDGWFGTRSARGRVWQKESQGRLMVSRGRKKSNI